MLALGYYPTLLVVPCHTVALSCEHGKFVGHDGGSEIDSTILGRYGSSIAMGNGYPLVSRQIVAGRYGDITAISHTEVSLSAIHLHRYTLGIGSGKEIASRGVGDMIGRGKGGHEVTVVVGGGEDTLPRTTYRRLPTDVMEFVEKRVDIGRGGIAQREGRHLRLHQSGYVGSEMAGRGCGCHRQHLGDAGMAGKTCELAPVGGDVSAGIEGCKEL